MYLTISHFLHSACACLPGKTKPEAVYMSSFVGFVKFFLPVRFDKNPASCVIVSNISSTNELNKDIDIFEIVMFGFTHRNTL